jgi:hypothetical protein
MKKQRVPWRDADVKNLREFYSKGNSDKQISELFGGKYSAKAILKKRHTIGLSSQLKRLAWPDSDTQSLKEFYAMGKTDNQISKLLGFKYSAKSIHTKRHRLGLVNGLVGEVRQAYREGEDPEEVREKHRIGTCNKHLEELRKHHPGGAPYMREAPSKRGPVIFRAPLAVGVYSSPSAACVEG